MAYDLKGVPWKDIRHFREWNTKDCDNSSFPPNRHPATKKLGWWSLQIAQIPTEACYDYLCAAGVGYNEYGEMLMSEEEYENYKFIIEMTGENNGQD